MTEERWKPVAELPDTYEVSDQGRVRRLTSVTRTKAGRLLKLTYSRDGYHQVGLSRPGTNPIYRRVHRLVWEAFQGPIPKDLVVNHINGKRDDNRLENLETVTCKENTLHAFRVLGRVRSGEKLCSEDIPHIRKRRAEGEAMTTLATEYNVTPACISLVCTGKTWKHAEGPITLSKTYSQTREDVQARIDDDTVRQIVRRYHAGESSGTLAKEYDVSDVTILNWSRGQYRPKK